MFTEIDKQLMLKFLSINYPIARVKLNNKFKRAIIVDNSGVYLFSKDVNQESLRYKMIQTLSYVFNCDEPTSKAVLSNYDRLLFYTIYSFSFVFNPFLVFVIKLIDPILYRS